MIDFDILLHFIELLYIIQRLKFKDIIRKEYKGKI